MNRNQSIHKINHRETQFNRILVAIRQGQVFLYPPLVTFMFGLKSWSLSPKELSVLSLLSEYGIPVVVEKLGISIGMLEDYVEDIYKKLEMTKEISTGSLN